MQWKEEKWQAKFTLQDVQQVVSSAYVYKGYVAGNKELVLKMLCRGSGIRDYKAVTGVSHSTMLALIKAVAKGITVKPQQHRYRRCR